MRATGIGSWPGTSTREAVRTVRDLLVDGDGIGIPFLPETPARGPGSEMVGRAAGLLVDLAVDLQPSGWRLVDRAGRDAGRTAALLREDLDELAEAYDGYEGPLKVQVCGPWTLAATLELTRGERVLTDPGAAADLAASLAEGVAGHVGDVRRLVPGAEVVLQLDEPALPAVLEGSLPTASGYGRVRPVDPQVVAGALRGAVATHDGPTVVHCCHPSAPIPLLRASGAGALALDLTAASPARWESVAATLEAGTGVHAGVLATDGSTSDAVALRTVLDGLERAGLAFSNVRGLVVTPACGLAGLTPEGPAAFSGRRSTPRAVSSRKWVPDGAAARPLAGQVRRARPHLGVELPAHEGRPRVARPRADLGAAHPHRGPRRRRAARRRGGRLPNGSRTWGHLLVCGFFLATLPFTLFALSETRIASALAGIGNAATPIATVLATIAILPGARVTGRRLVAVGVGFVGVVTIMQPWTTTEGPDLVGFSMALAGGASYGLGWTYNRRFLAGADLGGLAMPTATLLTGLGLMVPVTIGWAATTPQGLSAITAYRPATDVPGWLPLACVLALGVVGTGFAYVLQFDVVRGAGPVVGSTITYLIPVVSVLLGVLVLGERLGTWQVVGFAVVLAAAWVVNRSPRSPEAVVSRGRERAARM
ncbi:EamA family transporter [Phycicoccus sp. HDW14]|nr:EamA family transporter [Phycicoccus sp. HDW14]